MNDLWNDAFILHLKAKLRDLSSHREIEFDEFREQHVDQGRFLTIHVVRLRAVPQNGRKGRAQRARVGL